MYLSLNQAAKMVRKSTSTISKYIKDGKLSVAQVKDDGSFCIDPAELCRVFPEYSQTPKNEQTQTPFRMVSNDREIELLEKMNRQQADMIHALQEQLKEERSERQKMTIMLLEHQEQSKRKSKPLYIPDETSVDPVGSQPIKKRWWQRSR